MGRKLNLSHLSEEECEKILNVIQRDFNLREKEKQRLELVENELKEHQLRENREDEEGCHQRLQDRDKYCARCGTKFNFLFNKRLQCEVCHVYVCRDCCCTTASNGSSSSSSSSDVPAAVLHLCVSCYKHRVLTDQSCEWFYDHIKHKFKRFGGAKVVRSLYKRRVESDSENDSGYDPSTSVCSRDGSDNKFRLSKDSANSNEVPSQEIHEHIETLVEGLVGEALDNAHVNKIYKHPEYKCDDRSDVTPTSAHVLLKEIICEIVEEAMRLPNLQDSGNASASSPTSSSSISHEDDLEPGDSLEEEFSSYEDLLASAILNKVIEQYQKKTKLTDDTGTDTDDLQNCSTETIINNNNNDLNMTRMESENLVNNNSVRMSVDVGIQSDAPSELDNDSILLDASSLDDESATEDFTWANYSNTKEPIAYVIEEQIEEILTETYDTESEDERSSSTTKVAGSPPGVAEPIIRKSQVVNEVTAPELDYLYSGLDFVQSHRVPFPEFGVEIVEMNDCESDNSDFDPVSAVMTSVDSWEENWLFRKQKKAAAYGKIGHRHLGKYDDPIMMLIPNPSVPMPAKVGSMDVDELSDLSEQNSVGSIEFSPSDESEDEEMENLASQEILKLSDEIVSEFSQKDLEYTIDYYNESDKLHHKVEPARKESNKVHRKVEPARKESDNSHHMAEPARKKSDKLHHKIESARKLPPTPSINPQLHDHHTSNITQVTENSGIPIRKTSISLPKFIPTREQKTRAGSLSFVTQPESIVVHAGKTARIFAQVKGSKPIDVAWFHNGSLLNDGGRFQLYWLGDHKFYMDIFDTDLDDAGTYSCAAFNNKDQIWVDFAIKIKSSSRADNRPEFVSKLEDQSVKEGSSLRVSCKVSGYPEPQVIFYFKNRRLRNNEEYCVDNLGYGDWSVEIKTATLAHNGQVTACARNKVGEVKCSAVISTEPDNCTTELNSLTRRVNNAQKAVEEEAHNLLNTANQQAAANALRRTTGRALDLINKTDEATRQTRRNASPAVAMSHDINSQYSTPPKPGTIAEREHKKWLQADVPMPNSPYTPENLARRRDSLVLSSSGLPSSSLSNGKTGDHHDITIPDNTPRKIDCGLKQIQPERYQRDYYINNVSAPVPAQRSNFAAPKPMPRKRNLISPTNDSSSEKSDSDSRCQDRMNDKLNMVEEKVYMSAGRVYSLEDRIKQLESQVQDVDSRTNFNNVSELEDKVALAVAQVKQNDRSVSKVEEEVARIRQEVLQESRATELNNVAENIKNGHDNQSRSDSMDNSSNDENMPSLPSVKVLASKFRTIDVCDTKAVTANNKSKREKIPEKDVILVEKSDCNYNNIAANQDRAAKQKHVPDYKVHSLTARMVSKEFRDQVRLSNPKQNTRTLCIPQDDIIRATSPTGSNGVDSSADSRITSPSPVSGEPFQHGYTSDESTTSSNSLCHNDKPRRKSTRSILNRATYWEKRAEQGLLSDCSVNDDFPKIEQVPK